MKIKNWRSLITVVLLALFVVSLSVWAIEEPASEQPSLYNNGEFTAYGYSQDGSLQVYYQPYFLKEWTEFNHADAMGFVIDNTARGSRLYFIYALYKCKDGSTEVYNTDPDNPPIVEGQSSTNSLDAEVCSEIGLDKLEVIYFFSREPPVSI